MYTIHEIIDSLIEEEYALFKALISGNYAGFCVAFSDIMSKLAALRAGAKQDEDDKKAQIDDLKAQLKRANEPNPEPGETVIGGVTKTYNYFGEGE